MVTDHKKSSKLHHQKLNQLTQKIETNARNGCYLDMQKKNLSPNLKSLTIFLILKEMELMFNPKLKHCTMKSKRQLYVFVKKKIDKSLSKYFNNLFPWSPQMQLFRDCIEYWCHIIKQNQMFLQVKLP